MKTVLEAQTEATAVALLANGSTAWAKNEAAKATEHLKGMLKAKTIDTDTFADAVDVVSGNHSQRRQKMEDYGIITKPITESAERTHILAAMKALTEKALKG